MRRALLLLGAVAAAALLFFGAAAIVREVDRLSDTRIGDTRTRIPGTRTVDLDDGKYVVYYEVAGDGSVTIPAEPATIRRDGDGQPLDLESYGASFEVSTGDRTAHAAATIEVEEPGRYRIQTRAAGSGEDPAVVLGRPVTRRVLGLVAGIAAAMAGLGLGVLVVVVAVALRVRERRRPDTASGAG